MLSHAQFACSGLDRVDIYLNNKLKGTATFAYTPVIKPDTLSKPDTLMFHAFTNWEGLRDCTLDVKTELGELIDHINSTNNTGYEATFIYVFNRANSEDLTVKVYNVFINLLCERDVEPELIGTINIGSK